MPGNRNKMKGIGQKVNQTAEHHHHNLTLLHQLQTLEMLECYREFCYQLYLFSLATLNNPNYHEAAYNRYFHTDALGSITAITDDSGRVVERRSYEAFGKIRAMDYGTNNNSLLSNLTIETTRAFTGHEQIAELSGLIHMNARVYDSDIGRFLSADTLIQDPHDSQSYNRYSYVRNNPLKYTDPTGNSWWTKFRDKWLKPIVSIVVGAVIAIYAPQFLSSYMGIVKGTLASAVATGALAGAAGGAIMTGTLEGTLKGAAFGAVSAGVAYGIGEQLGHAGSIFGKNVKAGQAFIKASAHGISRGAISMAQGGTFRAGFASGFSSSFFSPGTSLGGDGAGGFTLRTTIAGVVGGTASEIGGGKFSNGAVSGAFVHMFNGEDLGRIGNAIRDVSGKLNSDFEQRMFARYWKGKGNYTLSSVEFNEILSSARVTSVGDNYITISLYDSAKYDYAIGTATLYYSSENSILRFYDKYDFDPQPYGGRSYSAELATTFTAVASPSTSRSFEINYIQR